MTDDAAANNFLRESPVPYAQKNIYFRLPMSVALLPYSGSETGRRIPDRCHSTNDESTPLFGSNRTSDRFDLVHAE